MNTVKPERAIKMLLGLIASRDNVIAAYRRKRIIRPSELAMSIASLQEEKDALLFAIETIEEKHNVKPE